MRNLYGQLEITVEKGDVVAFLNCDEALLTVLYRAGGNPVLLESIRGLWQRCRPYKIRGAQPIHDQANRSLSKYPDASSTPLQPTTRTRPLRSPANRSSPRRSASARPSRPRRPDA